MVMIYWPCVYSSKVIGSSTGGNVSVFATAHEWWYQKTTRRQRGSAAQIFWLKGVGRETVTKGETEKDNDKGRDKDSEKGDRETLTRDTERH